MQIGVKNILDDSDLKSIGYYTMFYDVLPTPDNDESSRLLNPNGKLKRFGDPNNKKCRFCDQDEKSVTFKKIAHAFPECIGNKVLATNYECDYCNEKFGDTIENEYANFFSLHHSIMQIYGKKGKTEAKYKIPCKKRSDSCMDKCISVTRIGDTPCIKVCEESGIYSTLSDGKLSISKPLGKCCPIAVFKTFVKMAVSVMPEEELCFFQKAIDWLQEEKHSNIFEDKELLVRFRMIPGFDVTKYPHYVLYKRKRPDFNIPYMLFNLTYGCFSFLVEIPMDDNQNTNNVFKEIPFPPIPFYSYESGMWNFSNTEFENGKVNSIVLNFDKQINCTNEIKANYKFDK